MKKEIAGLNEPKKLKPLSPIYIYEVDIGKGKPLYIEANRVDQIGQTLSFSIEYTDYILHVAGFSNWKSYQLFPGKKEDIQKERTSKLEDTPPKEAASQFVFSL